MGHLAGITRRSEHVAELGADAVRLSPTFVLPMNDLGCDVADCTDIDPLFGTLDDFDALVARAHALGLKVILDQVLDHTASVHPWFVESRRARGAERASWYVWPNGGAFIEPERRAGGRIAYDLATSAMSRSITPYRETPP